MIPSTIVIILKLCIKDQREIIFIALSINPLLFYTWVYDINDYVMSSFPVHTHEFKFSIVVLTVELY